MWLRIEGRETTADACRFSLRSIPATIYCGRMPEKSNGPLSPFQDNAHMFPLDEKPGFSAEAGLLAVVPPANT